MHAQPQPMIVVSLIISSCHLYLAIEPGENNLSLSYNNNDVVAPIQDTTITNPPMTLSLRISITVPINKETVNRDIKNKA